MLHIANALSLLFDIVYEIAYSSLRVNRASVFVLFFIISHPIHLKKPAAPSIVSCK